MHLGEINPDSCSISLKWSLQQLAASVNLVPCVKNVLNVAWTVFMISAPTSLIKSHVVNLEPDWGLCCCAATHWCLPLCLSVTIFYLIRHSFHRYETVIFTSALTARFHLGTTVWRCGINAVLVCSCRSISEAEHFECQTLLTCSNSKTQRYLFTFI